MVCFIFGERDEGHTYAVHVGLDNRNPQAVPPALLKAMGHVPPASTACCLSWIDPVIVQAVEYVAGHIRPGLAASSGGPHE